MSGVGEIIGIIACVAAIVSAYKDGSTIVQRIKEKRRLSRAQQPPEYLEESLQIGATAIQATHTTGVRRFGTVFEEGDDHALHALKDVQIKLLTGIVHELSRAREDDEFSNFATMIEVSDGGRIEAVNVLNDLFARMQARATVGRPLSQAISHTLPTSLSGYYPAPSQDLRFSQPRIQTLPLDDVSPKNPAPISAPPVSKPGERFNAQHPSYFRGMFKKKSKNSSSTQPNNDSLFLSGKSRASAPLQWPPTESRLNVPRPEPRQGRSLGSLSLAHNPWNESQANNILSANLRDSPLSRSVTVPIEHASPEPSLRQSTTTSSTSTSTSKDYKGFCKGAYKLQVGLKAEALTLRNQSNSFQGEGRYFACSNSRCCFMGPARRAGRDWDIAETLYGPRYGIVIRWSFLAKSHTEQSRVKNRQYQFRCVFCASQDRESGLFQGPSDLMQHLAMHRHDDLLCGDRVILEGEDSEIRFVANEPALDALSERSALSNSPHMPASVWSTSTDDAGSMLLDDGNLYDHNPWNDLG